MYWIKITYDHHFNTELKTIKYLYRYENTQNEVNKTLTYVGDRKYFRAYTMLP